MFVAQVRNYGDVVGDFVSAALLASRRVNPPVAVTHRQKREHGHAFQCDHFNFKSLQDLIHSFECLAIAVPVKIELQ